jgi:hypothetical protein
MKDFPTTDEIAKVIGQTLGDHAWLGASSYIDKRRKEGRECTLTELAEVQAELRRNARGLVSEVTADLNRARSVAGFLSPFVALNVVVAARLYGLNAAKKVLG